MTRFLLIFCLALPCFAYQKFNEDQLPPDLKPWVSWVMDGQESALCPTPFNKENNPLCAWPSRLTVRVDATQGSFSQSWSVYAPGWVILPGDQDLWPQDVQVNGRQQAVMLRDGRPAIRLDQGRYKIEGRWQWSTPPRSVPIPKETGLVSLMRDDQVVPYPRRDKHGQLWLAQGADDGEGREDRLTIRAFRLIEDEIPMRSKLLLNLEVSGKGREVVLGNPLLDGFQPMSLQSHLPARLNADGQLVVQLRAGQWNIMFESRAKSTPEALVLPENDEPWPKEELWSFAHRVHLRALVLSGFAQVDPTRTALPFEWQENPCFQALPGGRLALEERMRGLSAPAPNSVTLNRQLWLDFDGKGYTFQDEMTGSLNRQWRLSLVAPYDPGRVLFGDNAQLITVSGASGLPGVEVHEKDFSLVAEGRIEDGRRELPATGWDIALRDMNTELHLPPGWRLMGAFGPDRVQGDWLHSWRLWDFFWVLLLAACIGKLWSPLHGGCALITMVLLHGEDGASRVIWFAVILGIALQRVITHSGAMKIMRTLRWSAFGVLVLVSLPFVVQQFLEAMYFHKPQGTRTFSHTMLEAPYAESKMYQEEAQAARGKKHQYDLSLRGKVQTGPGIPSWESSPGRLIWQGPVDASEPLKLWILSPWMNRLMILLRVGFMIWLILLLTEQRIGRWNFVPKKGVSVALFAAMILISPTLMAQSGQPEMVKAPTPDLLQELQQRLLRKADCYPHCAQISKGSLTKEGEVLVLSLTAHAADQVALPIPGQPFKVDGELPLSMDASGQLWTLVPAGISEVRCRYRLTGKEQLPLRFPLKPHLLTADVDGWEISGLHEDGRCEEQIELRRTVVTDAVIAVDGTGDNFAPFVTIHRKAYLGNTWHIETTVMRNNDGPLVMEIPLLPGENVVSEARVVDGMIAVNRPAGSGNYTWKSVVTPRDRWTWQAPENGDWQEQWYLIPDRLWNVSWQGTPVIDYFREDNTWKPRWIPRQGETLELSIERPAPKSGQTLTIDEAVLRIEPGKRLTKCTLEMMVRSSVGGEHGITLPDGAEIGAYLVGSEPNPVRVEEGKLILPLYPDARFHSISWTLPQGASTALPDVPVDLHHNAVNVEVKVSVPYSRWALWVDGPSMGPALLFWPILFVLILISFALGRSHSNFLSKRQWFLLGLGVSQLHILMGLIVVAWFTAIHQRGRLTEKQTARTLFNLGQVFLLGLTVIFAFSLLATLHAGLLSQPNMYVMGNGSYSSELLWYADRCAGLLPQVTMISLPTWVYRVAMLLWSLWLSMSLLSWAKSAWEAFSKHRIFFKSGTTPELGSEQPTTVAGDEVKQPESPNEKLSED